MLPDLTRAQPRDAPAIEAEDRAWTYGELDDLANRYARRFLSLGLAPGERVSFVCANDARLVAAYLGAFRAGLVANPINNRLLPEEIAYIADHAGSRCLVASGEHLEVVEESLARLQARPALLVLGRDESSMPPADPLDPAPQPADGALLI